MHDILAWIELTAIGRAMRASGPWTYAFVNLGHVLGVATLFGSVAVLDLRLLGVWKRVPLSAVVASAVPVATAGFLLAVPTGVGLLATKATDYAGNPFLLVKFPAIVLGLVNVLVLKRTSTWAAIGRRDLSPKEDRQLAIAGGVSIACWFIAVAAGRLIAYW